MSAPKTPEEQEAKLGELMLYLSQLSKDDPNFNEWKLKELMWQCELQCFPQTGETITGCAYFKEPDTNEPATP